MVALSHGRPASTREFQTKLCNGESKSTLLNFFILSCHHISLFFFVMMPPSAVYQSRNFSSFHFACSYLTLNMKTYRSTWIHRTHIFTNSNSNKNLKLQNHVLVGMLQTGMLYYHWKSLPQVHIWRMWINILNSSSWRSGEKSNVEENPHI